MKPGDTIRLAQHYQTVRLWSSPHIEQNVQTTGRMKRSELALVIAIASNDDLLILTSEQLGWVDWCVVEAI